MFSPDSQNPASVPNLTIPDKVDRSQEVAPEPLRSTLMMAARLAWPIDLHTAIRSCSPVGSAALCRTRRGGWFSHAILALVALLALSELIHIGASWFIFFCWALCTFALHATLALEVPVEENEGKVDAEFAVLGLIIVQLLTVATIGTAFCLVRLR